MRRSRVLGSVAVGMIVAGGASVGGCFDSFEDCKNTATCPPSGEGGSGGNPVCEADPTQDPAAVIEDCGVFVSASAEPGGDGTKVRPFQSFAEAAAAAPKRVYACAEEYAETSGVSFSGGVEIYAGFADCGGAWTWSGNGRGRLTGPADAITLALDGGDNRIVRLEVVAPDASAPGGSAIGLLVNGGTLEMREGAVGAGAGMDGEAGASLEASPELNGAPGNNGSNACMGDLVQGNPGGEAASKMCPDATTSVGGKGGDGGLFQINPVMVLAGGDGEAGTPDGVGGQNGFGEPEMGAWSCIVAPGQGGANSGAPGENGGPGAGAGDTLLGTLTSAGFEGTPGDPGTPGMPGQGGGGGGGAKGGLICNMSMNYGLGASAGGGGSGGCGGMGGGGGMAGGASIAMISLGAQVTLMDVTLTAANGGRGGTGGNGQPGGIGGGAGQGGQPAGGSNPACPGGQGGKGGNGGPGGGGRGGHSLGIAHTGSMPQGAMITLGTAGDGGDGGQGNEAAGKGATGVAVETLAFE